MYGKLALIGRPRREAHGDVMTAGEAGRLSCDDWASASAKPPGYAIPRKHPRFVTVTRRCTVVAPVTSFSWTATVPSSGRVMLPCRQDLRKLAGIGARKLAGIARP